MLDSSELNFFAVDSRGQRDYHFSRRTGLLKRKFGDMQQNLSVELSAPQQASRHVDSRKFCEKMIFPDKGVFEPQRILRKNSWLIEEIENLRPEFWQVTFRRLQNTRRTAKNSGGIWNSHFFHCSVWIKLYLHGNPQAVELGEGNVREMSFNRDGLVQRMREIVQNSREAKTVSFPDPVPVVLAAGDGGIFFHEILGHSLEADHIYHGESPVRVSDVGKKLTSETVSLSTADAGDPFFMGLRRDDDAEKPAARALIEKGVLRHLVADREFGGLLNVTDRGHSRTEDFMHLPLPRMYALYLKPGKYDPQEIVESVDFGIYAREFGQGRVLFRRNRFFFHIKSAFLIEKGRLSRPLGSIMVQGSLKDAFRSVNMVGEDFRYDRGTSYCFKKGQTLNVRVGQPTVRIDNLQAGGQF